MVCSSNLSIPFQAAAVVGPCSGLGAEQQSRFHHPPFASICFGHTSCKRAELSSCHNQAPRASPV